MIKLNPIKNSLLLHRNNYYSSLILTSIGSNYRCDRLLSTRCALPAGDLSIIVCVCIFFSAGVRANHAPNDVNKFCLE